MKTFEFTVTDKAGIHARPAGLIAKKAKEFESIVTIEHGGKTVNAAKLIALMGMGVRQSDKIKITVEGSDEEAAAKAMEEFLRENL